MEVVAVYADCVSASCGSSPSARRRASLQVFLSRLYLPSPSLVSSSYPYLYLYIRPCADMLSSLSLPLTPPSPSASHLHSARTALYRTISPPSPTLVHASIRPVPNLELHSAAAEGNVGLVHYALTHGQPVNSVLHGVQAIHAAAAGGSVGAVKMLIDRGADVNAPRLPRRYSNEKKRGAPSLGAAGE
jgi:hypothetical protein